MCLSNTLKEFRKTNDVIGIRVSQGHLSLLSRKIWNVMLYHAQQLKTPGANAPIQNSTAKDYYWLPLAEVVKDAAYDSKDVELFKNHLYELQNIRIFLEDEVQWVSESLVSSVKLVNPAGLKKKGGQLWFGFAFPPEVANLVMSPSAYTKLSIYYQSQMRSGASLALYEICRRFATNPTKLTYRQTWGWWYGALTGNPVNDKLPEYKYFKRDVIKNAIAEINKVTDIQIELIEHKYGRQVNLLQFKVEKEKPQGLANFSERSPANFELLEKIMKLGISQHDATKLIEKNEEAKLLATLDLVENRLSNKRASPLENPAGYFKQALQNNYASATEVAKKNIQKQNVEKQNEDPVEAVKNKYLTHRANEALELFVELNQEEQENYWGEFAKNTNTKKMNMQEGIASISTKMAFGLWFAEQQWANPSDADLLRFVSSKINI